MLRPYPEDVPMRTHDPRQREADWRRFWRNVSIILAIALAITLIVK